MGIISEMLKKAEKAGYTGGNLTARVCQDIVLKAISRSALNRNVTIKGGVVMREITGDVRRATQDMDIDFIRYSLRDESIEAFVQKINVLEDIRIKRVGDITELSQQDYLGKRIYVEISDTDSISIQTKMDLGVHTHMDADQEEFCFDIGYDDEGVSLLINSKEQMFVEKLRSLLKFGAASTRYKDIFDMYYLKDHINMTKLKKYISEFVLDDDGMKENNMSDIINRLNITFRSNRYRERLSQTDKNWLEIDSDEALKGILTFVTEINIQ